MSDAYIAPAGYLAALPREVGTAVLIDARSALIADERRWLGMECDALGNRLLAEARRSLVHINRAIGIDPVRDARLRAGWPS